MGTDASQMMATQLSRDLSIYAKLDIEIDQITASLVVQDNKANLTFSTLSEALSALRLYLVSPAVHYHKTALEKLLNKLGITLYIQNIHLAVLGPNTNPILSRVVNFASSLIVRRA